MEKREVLIASLVVLAGLGIGTGFQNISLDALFHAEGGLYSNADIITEDPGLSSFSVYEDRIPEGAVNLADLPLEDFSNMYGPWLGSPLRYAPESTFPEVEEDSVIVYPSGTVSNPGDGNLIQLVSLPNKSDMRAVMEAKYAKNAMDIDSSCLSDGSTGFVSVIKLNSSIPQNPLGSDAEVEFSSVQANKTKVLTTNTSEIVVDIPDRFRGENVGLFGGVSPDSVSCSLGSKAIAVESLYIESSTKN